MPNNAIRHNKRFLPVALLLLSFVASFLLAPVMMLAITRGNGLAP